jgi:hypothetical protein
MNGDNETSTAVNTRISDREKAQLNQIAFQESTPNDRVTASDVVREAVRDYIKRYQTDPEKCAPGERGCLETDEELEPGREADQTIVEVVVPSNSSLVGETLDSSTFRQRFDANVLAFQ